MLGMHHNKGRMQEIYKDERTGGTLPDFRFKKVKLELTRQSLEQQSTRQTESLSFFLSFCLNVSLSLSIPHTGNADPWESWENYRDELTLTVFVCLHVRREKREGRKERRDVDGEKKESSKSRVNTHHTVEKSVTHTPITSSASHLSPQSPRQ